MRFPNRLVRGLVGICIALVPSCVVLPGLPGLGGLTSPSPSGPASTDQTGVGNLKVDGAYDWEDQGSTPASVMVFAVVGSKPNSTFVAADSKDDFPEATLTDVAGGTAQLWAGAYGADGKLLASRQVPVPVIVNKDNLVHIIVHTGDVAMPVPAFFGPLPPILQSPSPGPSTAPSASRTVKALEWTDATQAEFLGGVLVMLGQSSDRSPDPSFFVPRRLGVTSARLECQLRWSDGTTSSPDQVTWSLEEPGAQLLVLQPTSLSPGAAPGSCGSLAGTNSAAAGAGTNGGALAIAPISGVATEYLTTCGQNDPAVRGGAVVAVTYHPDSGPDLSLKIPVRITNQGGAAVDIN